LAHPCNNAQFYCNGHSALAQSLKREGIGFAQADNAFLRIDNLPRAQELADALSPDVLHQRLRTFMPSGFVPCLMYLAKAITGAFARLSTPLT
jgi:hypothetical protein